MRKDPNVLSMLLILLLVIAALIYFTPVILTGNLLWFVASFDTPAEQIIIYREGKEFTLRPRDPGFTELTAACNELVSEIKAVHRSFGISDVGLDQLRAEGVAVELFYAEPLDFPTPVNLGGPNQLLIPLSGHYTQNPVALRGFDGEYWGAALRLGDLEKLKAIVATLEQ